MLLICARVHFGASRSFIVPPVAAQEFQAPGVLIPAGAPVSANGGIEAIIDKATLLERTGGAVYIASAEEVPAYAAAAAGRGYPAPAGSPLSTGWFRRGGLLYSEDPAAFDAAYTGLYRRAPMPSVLLFVFSS